MSMRQVPIKLPVLIVTFLATLSLVSGSVRAENKEKVLYSFMGGNDSQEPLSIVPDKNGNLVGLSFQGGGAGCGTQGCGTLFELDANNTLHVVYAFTGSSDGENPSGSPLIGRDGNFYGVTSGGGNTKCSGGCGVVFQISPSGIERTLYAFKGGKDGSLPLGGLAQDKRGNFYGVTIYGGDGDYGTVFKLAPSGKKTIIHSFSKYIDGMAPAARLAIDAFGNLYGTTSEGGPYLAGTIFELTSTGVFGTLHDFYYTNEGGDTNAVLLGDKKGNLFGTAPGGGNNSFGTAFRFSSDGSFKVLHAFGARGDGRASPSGGLIMDRQGNLFGVSDGGGQFEQGFVYELPRAGKREILYSFKTSSDGGMPTGELVLDKSGNLFGVALAGGAHGSGAIFEIYSQHQRSRGTHFGKDNGGVKYSDTASAK